MIYQMSYQDCIAAVASIENSYHQQSVVPSPQNLLITLLAQTMVTTIILITMFMVVLILLTRKSKPDNFPPGK